MATDPLLLHLAKIPAPPPAAEESLSEVLETLWRTRKTGLSTLQKPFIQSLLGLPTLQDLDLVVACLRSIIRKCVREKLVGEDSQKLLPPDLSIELRRILIMLIQKHQDQWTVEESRDQRVPYGVNINTSPALTSSPTSRLLSSLWPRQDDANNSPNSSCLGGTIPSYVVSDRPCMKSTPLNREIGSFDNLAILPRLKSMTWTMQNRNLMPSNRVAIITLKLHDYSKSPSGEIEVKFQLSKDALDAMLRSMTYISEQLSNSVGVATPTEPSSKEVEATT